MKVFNPSNPDEQSVPAKNNCKGVQYQKIDRITFYLHLLPLVLADIIGRDACQARMLVEIRISIDINMNEKDKIKIIG